MQPSSEIIIGLVGSIGVDFDIVIKALQKEFALQNFAPEIITLSSFVDEFRPKKKFKSEVKRIDYYMDEGTALRKDLTIDCMSKFAIAKIIDLRKLMKSDKPVLYILKSLKRPEEIDALRNTYKKRCIIVSINSPEKIKIKNLAKTNDINLEKPSQDEISQLMKKDFNEQFENYGQRLIDTFPKADVFINTAENVDASIKRFVDILFGHPFHTPTKHERSIYIAKGVSLRSADPSRPSHY